MMDKSTALLRKCDVEEALRRSLVDDQFIPGIVDRIPSNTVEDVLNASGLRQQLEIAVGALESQEQWMSLKIVKANLRDAIAQIRELEK